MIEQLHEDGYRAAQPFTSPRNIELPDIGASQSPRQTQEPILAKQKIDPLDTLHVLRRSKLGVLNPAPPREPSSVYRLPLRAARVFGVADCIAEVYVYRGEDVVNRDVLAARARSRYFNRVPLLELRADNEDGPHWRLCGGLVGGGQ